MNRAAVFSSIVFIIIIVAALAAYSKGIYPFSYGEPIPYSSPPATATITAPGGVPTESPTGSASAPASVSVEIINLAYNPATITIKKGTTVSWRNQDDVGHTVTGDDAAGPASELLAKGGMYSFTFENVGTFTYHCQVHPTIQGTVVVTE